MRNLTGKTALVTGVTGGIGPSIVRELAKEQMKLRPPVAYSGMKCKDQNR